VIAATRLFLVIPNHVPPPRKSLPASRRGASYKKADGEGGTLLVFIPVGCQDQLVCRMALKSEK
jgi:hypothetical protein